MHTYIRRRYWVIGERTEENKNIFYEFANFYKTTKKQKLISRSCKKCEIRDQNKGDIIVYKFYPNVEVA